MTNYGGGAPPLPVDGRTVDTPAGVAHYLEHKMFDLPNGDNALNFSRQTARSPNAFHFKRRDLLLLPVHKIL